MNRLIASTAIPARAVKIEAPANMTARFETTRERRAARDTRAARTEGCIAGARRKASGFHGGKVEIERPRLRSFDGKGQALPSWEGATTEDWLGKWAMNQMLINVSTSKFKRSVRLPEGEVPAPKVRSVAILLRGLAKKCGAVDGPATLAANPRESLPSFPSGQSVALAPAPRARLTQLSVEKTQKSVANPTPTAGSRMLFLE